MLRTLDDDASTTYPLPSRSSTGASGATLVSGTQFENSGKPFKSSLDGIPSRAGELEESKVDGDRDLNEGGEIVLLPMSQKVISLTLIFLFVLGSGFAGSSLGPLKSTIKSDLDISNSQYAVLAAADSLVNTILPVITGLAVDYYGPRRAAIVSCAFILTGTVLSAIGGTVKNYPLLVVGHIVLGFGSISIETVQNKLYVFWFKGSSLGLILGLDVAIGRAYHMTGSLTSYPIARSRGNWVWTLWVVAMMSLVSLLAAFAYFFFERTLPNSSQLVTGRQKEKETSRFAKRSGAAPGKRPPNIVRQWRYIRSSMSSLPGAFWLLCITQLLQSGAALTYLSNVADMVQVTRGASKLTAGYTSAVAQVLPVVICPLLGALFDWKGFRMHYVSTTAALWIVTFSLMGFTNVNAFAPIIIGSLALALNVVPFVAAIPLLVPNQENMGSAYGVWKAFSNCGESIVNVASGALQDLTPTGTRQYSGVFYLLIGLKSFEFVLGGLYLWFDGRYLNGYLRASQKELLVLWEDETEEEKTRGIRGASSTWTRVGLAFGAASLVTAWVVYIYYAI